MCHKTELLLVHELPKTDGSRPVGHRLPTPAPEHVWRDEFLYATGKKLHIGTKD